MNVSDIHTTQIDAIEEALQAAYRLMEFAGLLTR